MQNTKHYLAVITASIIWGCFSFLLKPLAGFASLDILFYRVFLSAVLMILFGVLFRRHAWKEDRKKYLQMGIPIIH